MEVKVKVFNLITDIKYEGILQSADESGRALIHMDDETEEYFNLHNGYSIHISWLRLSYSSMQKLWETTRIYGYQPNYRDIEEDPERFLSCTRCSSHWTFDQISTWYECHDLDYFYQDLLLIVENRLCPDCLNSVDQDLLFIVENRLCPDCLNSVEE